MVDRAFTGLVKRTWPVIAVVVLIGLVAPLKTSKREQAEEAATIAGTPSDPAGEAALAEGTVFVMPRGKKYHRDGCRHLASTKRAISIEEAKGKYEACRRCWANGGHDAGTE